MKDISGLNSNAHMANGWNEAKLRKKLWDMKPSYLEYVLANFKRSAFRPLPRCHEITACAEKAELLERVPNCRTAWSIYRTVAWDEIGDAVTALNERVSSEDETTDLSFEESNSHTKTVPENCIPLAPLKRPSRQTIEPPPPAPICKEDLWRPGMSFNDDLVVYFTTGEADLNDDQVMNVQSWIQRISSNANGRFNLNVSGHADERGTPASNKELSRRRALTVNALIQPYTAELADYKTTLIPFGESKPP
jgi:outer membrane protein OmpA-like peptidoglycan-associated protein